MSFQVDVTLGGHSWTLTENRGEVSDGIHVLSGMDFGWTAQDGVWPRQPNPMTAAFSLTVPNFPDLDAGLSSPCIIDVRADTAGPVVARFAGYVTDLRATSRPGRSGVTVSVIAVDPMATLYENLGTVLPYVLAEVPPEGGPTEKDSARGIWLNSGLTGDLNTVWTSPDRQMGLIVTSFDPVQQAVPAREWLTALLDQAVNMTDPEAASRMILAPDLSSGTLAYTLDTIVAGLLEGFPDVSLPAGMFRQGLSWATNKSTAPDQVDVSGTPSGIDFDTVTFGGTVSAGMYGSGSGARVAMTGHFHLESDAQDTADFYALHPLPRWQLEPLTVFVSRGIKAGTFTAADVPEGLFPDWTLTPGDPDRASCYSRHVWLTDLPDDQLPFEQPEPGYRVPGWLTGARCRISGGELELDVTIRQQAT